MNNIVKMKGWATKGWASYGADLKKIALEISNFSRPSELLSEKITTFGHSFDQF